MKALLCKAHGLPETLVVEDVPSPVPGPGEVRIRIRAAGVNFPDALIIQNKYQFKPALPFSPGSEVAGDVQALGEGVSHLKPGDRVMASVGHGGFAEEVVVPVGKVVPIPEGVSYALAASFTLVYGTSYHAVLDRGQLQAGQTMLVLGAAGGVGLSAVEIGKAVGAKVIAAASTDEKLAVCREHGADATINYSTEDLRERIKVLTNGQGPDVIYDPVGGTMAEPAFRSIGWRGRYLVVGFAQGQIPAIPLNLTLLKGASIVGVFWGDYTRREPKNFQSDMAAMLGWMREGRLKPRISARYSLAEAPKAIRALMDRQAIGKLVVEP